jgi:hypothetical protein
LGLQPEHPRWGDEKEAFASHWYQRGPLRRWAAAVLPPTLHGSIQSHPSQERLLRKPSGQGPRSRHRKAQGKAKMPSRKASAARPTSTTNGHVEAAVCLAGNKL